MLYDASEKARCCVTCKSMQLRIYSATRHFGVVHRQSTTPKNRLRPKTPSNSLFHQMLNCTPSRCSRDIPGVIPVVGECSPRCRVSGCRVTNPFRQRRTRGHSPPHRTSPTIIVMVNPSREGKMHGARALRSWHRPNIAACRSRRASRPPRLAGAGAGRFGLRGPGFWASSPVGWRVCK